MKGLNRIFALLLMAVLAALSCMGSYPIVRSFPKKSHEGGPQTWTVANDTLGRMFFGNKNGLLVYDSDVWQLQGIDYGSTVRALLYDSEKSRLYAGGSEEFGYFSYESDSGNFSYKSLTALLPASVSSFKEIWNIFTLQKNGNVWFQSDNYLFEYDGKSIKPFKTGERITASASLNGRIYVALAHGGIAELDYGRLKNLPRGSLPANARVVEFLPYFNGVMIVTEYHGLFTLEHGKIQPLNLGADDFLCSSQVFCAAAKDDNYVFGTVSNGVMIINIRSGRCTFANIETGLQNNTVLSAYFDDDNNLWLGLDNGIDMIQVDLPYYSLLGATSRYGAGYVSLRSGDDLYLGTNQGLFVMPYSDSTTPEPPRLKPLVSGQIWDVKDIDGRIFVCSDAGLYVGDSRLMTRIDGIPGTWSVGELPQSPDYLLVSTYETFYMLHLEGGRWVNRGPVDGYNDIGGRFQIDGNGDVWIAHWLKGIYRLTINPERNSFVSNQFFNQEHGLPHTRSVSLAMYDGKPVMISDGGFSSLAADGRSIVPHKKLNAMLNTPVAPMFHQSPRGDIWTISENSVTRLTRNLSGELVADSITFSPIADQIILGFENLNFINDNRMIVSMQDGFYDVNLAVSPEHRSGKQVYFRVLQAYGDSVSTLYPNDAACDMVSLPFSMNSLRAEAVMVEYRADKAVSYSFFLENYDSGWSEYSPMSYKEYTHLPEGQYLMHVRSFNSFNRTTSEAVMTICILPPWYRSTAAKIVYLLLVLSLLLLAYYWFRRVAFRASRQVAARKEQELEDMRRKAREESLLKDYEIAELKSRHLENDVQHKTEELSNITMNVVRKNEILLDISDRLTRLSRSELSGEVSRQIAKIQSLIKENITRDDDWRNFIRTFDAAYGNFTKHLQERHPGLSPTELRVCCYLIMGLNSKEIAQLFNISYRSVEMSRYRLRKKLGLVRETSLTEYLNGIFAEIKTVDKAR